VGLIRRIFGYRGLDDEEKKVVGILRMGPIRQKELIKQLGVNPVRFNKLMRSLEEQKIAKREPKGRENVVRLL